MGKKERGLGRKGGGNWFFSPSPLPEIFPNCVVGNGGSSRRGKEKCVPRSLTTLKGRGGEEEK